MSEFRGAPRAPEKGVAVLSPHQEEAITAPFLEKEALMRNRLKKCLVLAFLALWLGGTRPVAADWVTYWGCLECNYRTNITFARDFCGQVGHEETGATQCTEFHDGLQTHCFTGGDACFNVTVTGGGGGGGGTGGGGGSCVYQPGGYCPAECPSCSGSGGFWL